eukprot:COSAG01_NODE_646_length_14556_cov_9.736806_15_plen_91_part_00
MISTPCPNGDPAERQIGFEHARAARHRKQGGVVRLGRRNYTAWAESLRDLDRRAAAGAASVASSQAAVLAEIYLCNVCSCQEILRRNGRG